MRKRDFIFDYVMFFLLSFMAFAAFAFGTKEHLCCDGGPWYTSILIWLGCIMFKSLVSLILTIIGGVRGGDTK